MCITKLLVDGKDGYDVLKYFSPLSKDFSLIKYDQELKAKASHIFSLGKCPYTVDELLEKWEILENRYYWVEWWKARRHFRKVNEREGSGRELTEEDFPENISLRGRVGMDLYFFRVKIKFFNAHPYLITPSIIYFLE